MRADSSFAVPREVAPDRVGTQSRRGCLRSDMRRSFVGLLALATGLSAACILRPGMNAQCVWPPEPPRRLDLGSAADRRHLVVDTELVEELVDRYRFHVPNDQPACETRLIDAVGRAHSVSVGDVARARDQISWRGLDLPVTIPVATLFVFTVMSIAQRTERRFADEPVAAGITLAIASVAVTVLFVLIGEFWTSILQMIRVGSQHVGGRVARLPWKRYEREIFFIGIVFFWSVVALRRTASWRLKSGIRS
jgi:hypothetical protein